MRRIVTTAVALTLLSATAGRADAASWTRCSLRTTTTQWMPGGYGAGVYLSSGTLRVRSPMNCGSGRYAMRRARREFRRRGYLPKTFHDGYVRWYGFVVFGGRWFGTGQYEEDDSGTAFRFHYEIWGD